MTVYYVLVCTCIHLLVLYVRTCLCLPAIASQCYFTFIRRYTSGDVAKDDIPVKVDGKKPAVKEQTSDLTDKPFVTVVELYNMLQKQPEEVCH